MNLVTLGLSKILGKSGEPTACDFAETDYTAFGLTYQDTCNMAQEDPEMTEFYSEEEDDPIETITRNGKITFNFSIMNPDTACLKRLFGGSVDSSGIWKSATTSVEIEESLIILPKKGLKFQIPRAKVNAKINGEFSKKGLFLIDVVATVLKPATTGLSKIYAKPVGTSTSGSGSGSGGVS